MRALPLFSLPPLLSLLGFYYPLLIFSHYCASFNTYISTIHTAQTLITHAKSHAKSHAIKNACLNSSQALVRRPARKKMFLVCKDLFV